MDIPRECRRLAEVDFPIAAVGAYSLAEKARRMGTPHQVHLWWAWRPLAACRAMLLGLLLPDPCDPRCPVAFRTGARTLVGRVIRHVDQGDSGLQHALLRFIGQAANWDLARNRDYVDVERRLIGLAHGDEAPLVVDTFAGGGSIPLEALRAGCEVFASDLNPVACLILKTKLEALARDGHQAVDRLRADGARMRGVAEQGLSRFYPHDRDGARPIAYLWARTVRCESPNCGAEIPLMRSLWLCKKPSRRRALRPKVVRHERKPPEVELEIFEPKSDREVRGGTVSHAKATCLCCNMVLPAARVRSQLLQQRGGADAVFDGTGSRIGGARLLAVVTLFPGQQGRHYRVPTSLDYSVVCQAAQYLHDMASERLAGGVLQVPDEPTPVGGGSGAGRAFSLRQYGVSTWGDLFTRRQLLALSTLCRFVREVAEPDGRELLALAVSKLAERNNTVCDWMVDVECPGHLYTQQVIPSAWDFAEAVIFSDASGSILPAIENTAANASSAIIASPRVGNVGLADARRSGLPDVTCPHCEYQS